MTTDPYTKIHNTVLEALARTDLSGAERRVLDVIFRQTYGYQVKEADISVSLIVKKTGMTQRAIYYALGSLKTRKMIIRSGSKTRFSKNFIASKLQNHSDEQNCRLNKIAKNVKKRGVDPLNKIADIKETLLQVSKKNPSGGLTHQDFTKKPPASHSNDTKKTRTKKTIGADSKLSPLSAEKLYEIADKKNIPLSQVIRTHEQVLLSLEDGNKYKIKSVNLTLQNWLNMGLERGNLQTMSESERMLFDARKTASFDKIHKLIEEKL